MHMSLIRVFLIAALVLAATTAIGVEGARFQRFHDFGGDADGES